ESKSIDHVWRGVDMYGSIRPAREKQAARQRHSVARDRVGPKIGMPMAKSGTSPPQLSQHRALLDYRRIHVGPLSIGRARARPRLGAESGRRDCENRIWI